jgi:hypothetical protein
MRDKVLLLLAKSLADQLLVQINLHHFHIALALLLVFVVKIPYWALRILHEGNQGGVGAVGVGSQIKACTISNTNTLHPALQEAC